MSASDMNCLCSCPGDDMMSVMCGEGAAHYFLITTYSYRINFNVYTHNATMHGMVWIADVGYKYSTVEWRRDRSG
jgi:hypothetical protein